MSNLPHQMKTTVLVLLVGGLAFLPGCISKQDEDPEEAQERTAQELAEKAEIALAHDDQQSALVHMEKIVYNHPDAKIAQSYKLKLADLYFAMENFESAYQMYRGYTKLYPSDDNSPNARFQSILAKYNQTLQIKAECDSTTAQKTMKLCSKYLADTALTEHRDEVAQILKTCESRLINKEFYVFNSYLAYGKIQSASKRLSYLRETYLESHPELEAQILYLECKLAKAEEQRDRQKVALAQLTERYPSSEYTRMAQSIVNRSSFW